VRWLHTTSSLSYTYYRNEEKRGAIPEGGEGGFVVHVHFKPYCRMNEVGHVFSNGRHPRELDAD
jgi:transposase